MFYIWRSSSVHDLDAVSFFGVGIPILFARCQRVVGGMPYTSEARDKLSFLVLNDKILLSTDQPSSTLSYLRASSAKLMSLLVYVLLQCPNGWNGTMLPGAGADTELGADGLMVRNGDPAPARIGWPGMWPPLSRKS